MAGLATLGPLLIGVSLILMAFRQFLRAARDWRRTTTLRSWPTVTGRITHSQVKYSAPHDDPNYSHAYEPEVYFEYLVDGRMYASAEFVDRAPDLEEKVRAIVDRYPVGRQVTVYYDPSNPRSAMLESGTGRPQWPAFGTGLVELVTGFALAVISVTRLV